jgi:hypothetical protein
MAHGAKTSTGSPGQATIEPEVAEYFASTYVPVWQLDDASFSAGGALSSEDIRALGAESRTNSRRPEPQAPPSALLEGASVELSTPLAGDPSPQGPEATAPPISAAALPAAASTHDFEGDVDFRPRASKRLLMALGVGVAAVVTLVGLAFTRSEAPAQPVSLATTAPLGAPESVPIPPPIPVSDITTPPKTETITPQAPARRPASPAHETNLFATSLLSRPSTDHPPAQTLEPSSPPRSPVEPPGPPAVPAQKGDPRPPKRSIDPMFGI